MKIFHSPSSVFLLLAPNKILSPFRWWPRRRSVSGLKLIKIWRKWSRLSSFLDPVSFHLCFCSQIGCFYAFKRTFGWNISVPPYLSSELGFPLPNLSPPWLQKNSFPPYLASAPKVTPLNPGGTLCQLSVIRTFSHSNFQLFKAISFPFGANFRLNPP